MDRLSLIPLEKIYPNPNQPRKLFDAASITELAASICEVGLLSPLLVKKTKEGFMIIAGERRWRACRLCKIEQVPCLISSFNDEQSALASLIENLQRKNLNPFEEAKAIQALISTFALTQAQAAAKLGKSQSAVANKLRLLSLGEGLQEKILKSGLSERHARELLRLEEGRRERALDYINQKGLNVEQTAKYIDSLLVNKQRPKKIVAFKDIRLFFNTIDRSLKTLKSAGIKAQSQRQETENFIRYEIIIPKKVQ